ncbi:MAG TPA: DUF1385 domain-containing protein [Candidatus Limnocylindria bacterium]|nr:DUF1385 domain-containing protein [Candidatus Limnocylindria bacterium]
MARSDFGGQALLEGVLMRGRNSIGIALRHPDGSIVATQEPLNSILHRNRFARAPFFRGLVLLYETLVIGTRWLMKSGSVQAEGEGQELGKGTIALTLIVTLGMAIGLFVLLPLFLAGAATSAVAGPGQTLLAHLVEGLIRVVIFVGYLLIVSRFGDIQRTFQYHGAEHMTIHALEHEDPLTIEEVRKYPTAHQRCGTEFLVIFIILSILMFSLLAGQSLVVSIVGRVLLVPVIASIAYELLRFGARYRQHWWIRWLYLPGIWLQSITTRQPDDGMIEVAIASMREALAANREEAPAGSLDPERRPIPVHVAEKTAGSATDQAG